MPLATILLQIVATIITDPNAEKTITDWFQSKGISPADLASLVGSLQPPAQPGTEE